MLILYQQEQNEECIVLPTFIIQSSEVMQQQLLSHKFSKESLHSIALVSVSPAFQV